MIFKAATPLIRRLLIIVICLTLTISCQLLPKPHLLIQPTHLPVRSALIQGKIIKEEKTQALSAMLESDGQNFKVIMLNPFGQRSRTLISEPLGWSRQQFIPDINLIDDAALLTSLLCVFAGPLHTQVSKGSRWVGGDLIESLEGATVTHKIIYSGDPWNTSSTYLKQINNPRKQINNKVVFELQLQAAPF